MLYGRPGIGKTTLAASAQEHEDMSPVLTANFEGGLLSIGSRGDIDAVDIKTIEQVDELFWLIRNGTPPYDQYKTLVIDSGSEMQTLALEEAVRLEMAKKEKQGRLGDRTIDDIEIQNYGKSGAQLARMFRWFRDLPINLIITALPKFVFPQGADTRTSQPIEVCPSFTNKLGVQVMGYVDFLWYLYEEGGIRKLLTRDTGSYRAKTRGYNFSLALGNPYPNPWLPTIYNLLIEAESVPIGQYQPAIPIPGPSANINSDPLNPVTSSVFQNGSVLSPTEDIIPSMSDDTAAQVDASEIAQEVAYT
jgi:hypothetical protein